MSDASYAIKGKADWISGSNRELGPADDWIIRVSCICHVDPVKSICFSEKLVASRSEMSFKKVNLTPQPKHMSKTRGVGIGKLAGYFGASLLPVGPRP